MLTQKIDLGVVRKKLLFKKGAVMTVTSSAGAETELDMAELASLQNIGAADLAKIDGITNGTQAAGKAVVADANVNTGVSKVTQLWIGATGSETQVTATAAELNYVDLTTLGTGAASKAIVLDANCVYTGPTTSTAVFTWGVSSGTVGNIEPFIVSSTLTGAGATGGRAKFALAANAALGGWSNAIKGIVTYNASGKTTGMGSAVCAELVMSTGTNAGTYAPLESEITLGASAAIGTATSFLYCNVTDDSATFNTNGYFFELGSGVVDTSGGMYDQVSSQVATATARLRVRVGGATWYVPLCANSALN